MHGAMDVDGVSMGSTNGGGQATLKRSSSAPLINELVSQPTSVRSPTLNRFCTSPLSHVRSEFQRQSSSRVRRFSANFSLSSPPPPVSPGGSSGVRTPSRLMQIRHEEGLEEREIRHERNVHVALQMSQSCEDLVLSAAEAEDCSKGHHPPRSVTDPLHLTMPHPHVTAFTGCLPSPTRPPGRLCLSPSLGLCRSGVQPLSPSPSPSPTRRSISRRSMSPITLRPSPLGGAGSCFKRKWDVDGAGESAPSRACHKTGGSTPKRFHSGGLLSSTGYGHPEPGGGLSVSGQLPTSSVGTPDSLSSAGSPCVAGYKPDSPSAMSASSSLFRPVQAASSLCFTPAAMDTATPSPPAPPPPAVRPPVVAMETGSPSDCSQQRKPSMETSSVDVIHPLAGTTCQSMNFSV